MKHGRSCFLGGLGLVCLLGLEGAWPAGAECASDRGGRSGYSSLPHLHRHPSRTWERCRHNPRADRPKRRYEGGRYITFPGYWSYNGREEIWVPPYKVWKPGYYYYE